MHLADGNIDLRLTDAVLYIGSGADLLKCLLVLLMIKALPSLNRICQLRRGRGCFVPKYLSEW